MSACGRRRADAGGGVAWFGSGDLTLLHDAGYNDEEALRWLYTAWLGAFGLKMLGSSWDVSWHFKWLRDDLAPPRGALTRCYMI